MGHPALQSLPHMPEKEDALRWPGAVSAVSALRCFIIYDLGAGKTWKSSAFHQSQEDPPSARRRQIENLAAEVQILESQFAQTPHGSSLNAEQQNSTPEGTVATSLVSTQDCEKLSPDDSASPVTAVHVMIHPSPNGQPQRKLAGWNPWNQSSWYREEYRSRSVVKANLVDDVQARRLFADFMQQCNVATPIFDSVLDTYESSSE